MKPTKIEGWTLKVLDALLEGQPNEDSRVELKREWVDSTKTARRIAGHANAARGDHLLWLVGVDEKAGSVPGVMAFGRRQPAPAG